MFHFIKALQTCAKVDTLQMMRNNWKAPKQAALLNIQK